MAFEAKELGVNLAINPMIPPKFTLTKPPLKNVNIGTKTFNKASPSNPFFVVITANIPSIVDNTDNEKAVNIIVGRLVPKLTPKAKLDIIRSIST